MTGKKTAISLAASIIFITAFVICAIFLTIGQTELSGSSISYRDGVFFVLGKRYVIIPEIKDFFAIYLDVCNDFWNTFIPKPMTFLIKQAAESVSAAIMHFINGIAGCLRYMVYGNM